MTISFTVPGEPRGKGRPRFARVGDGVKTYTPRETEGYEAQVRAAFLAAGGRSFNGAPMCVRVTAFYAIPQSESAHRKRSMQLGFELPTKKPDCDNVLKIICDALNRCAYDDDKQIISAVVLKKYSLEPRVEVTLTDGDGERK